MSREEARKPPPNLGRPTTLAGALKLRGQHFLDLQVATVVADMKRWLEARRGSILEVGCGDQPYRHFLPADCTYTGLDAEHARRDFRMQAPPDTVYYSGDTFPFPDASFDNLFHTEVLEHVVDYRTFLRECRRVLKPGAALAFSVPFQARYHFAPHDYWRFTPTGLETILGEAGFEEIRVVPRGTDITVAMYKVAAVFYRWAYQGIAGKAAFVAASPAMGVMLSAAHASAKFTIGSTDDCLGYTVYATAKEAITQT